MADSSVVCRAVRPDNGVDRAAFDAEGEIRQNASPAGRSVTAVISSNGSLNRRSGEWEEMLVFQNVFLISQSPVYLTSARIMVSTVLLHFALELVGG